MNLLKRLIVGVLYYWALFSIVSCTMVLTDARIVPRYHGVDPQLSGYVNEWLLLAEIEGITFKRSVSVGFTDIDRKFDHNLVAVAQCNYSVFFREIDVEPKYWEMMSNISRFVTMAHELTHCYCGRSHTFGAGIEYRRDGKGHYQKEGFFEDGCPISILYPEVLPDSCTINHLPYYLDEMFRGCRPY